MTRVFRLLLLAVSLIPSICSAEGETDDDEKAKRRNEQLQKKFQEQAESYEFTVAGNDQPLILLPKPVFHWLNRARVKQVSVHYGAVYVWTRQGRAEAVGTIFSVSSEKEPPAFYHEFHSLATGPLKATSDGAIKWDTPDPGLKFAPFIKSDRPGDTPARRLAEMRAMARRFTGYSNNYDDTRWQLNLLPQPLYRMPESTGEVLDQAVFALISTAGTDPEVLLVIEARKEKDGFQWQYALCRFTDLQTYVSLDDVEVWSFANGTKGAFNEAGPTKPYRFLSAGTIPLEE